VTGRLKVYHHKGTEKTDVFTELKPGHDLRPAIRTGGYTMGQDRDERDSGGDRGGKQTGGGRDATRDDRQSDDSEPGGGGGPKGGGTEQSYRRGGAGQGQTGGGPGNVANQ
jgi:hypothetical protein